MAELLRSSGPAPLAWLSSRRCRSPRFVREVAFVVGLAVVALPLTSLAGPDGGVADAAPSSSASVPATELSDAGPGDASADVDAGIRADVADLLELAEQIAALLEERLEADLAAESLFDIDISSERAIAVEAERLVRVLRELDPEPADPNGDAGSSDGGPAARPDRAIVPGDADGGAGGSAAVPERDVEPYPLADPELLAARLAVDRQRLRFYRLGKKQRDAVVASHVERRADAAARDEEAELSEAERKQRQAAAEREKALRAARQARTEAERLVAEERARLLGIKEQHGALDATLIAEKRGMDEFADALLGWLRPADEVLEAKRDARPKPGRIDRIYDALVEHLAATRLSFAQAIVNVDSMEGTPQLVGDDPLMELPVDIDRKSLTELRSKLGEVERELLSRREQLRWKRMRQLHKAVRSLDARRRGLVALLSDDKRDDILGFGPEGFEQARGEASQVGLLLQYHTQETQRWLQGLGSGKGAGGSAVVIAVTALKWLLPVALFVWWRRRAARVLERWRQLVRERARATRRQGRRSFAERAVRFVQRTHGPLAWLLLAGATLWLLPKGASKLLEVELAWTVVLWTLGGLLVVHAIDALFEGRRTALRGSVDVDKLRLRTFLLVGRVAVALGLLLSLTNELVGRGTIYDWVFTTCFWAVAPIGLVVVQWWRPVILHHVDRRREEHVVLSWVDKLRDGWGGFFAAAGGGLYLLISGVVNYLRLYVGSIDWVRRVLAAWFRHDVDRKTEGKAAGADDEPIEPELYAALGPDRPAPELLSDGTEKSLAELLQRIRRPGGAVVAVVGERGSGKTTLLERIAQEEPSALRVNCSSSGIGEFQSSLRAALELPSTTSGDRLREHLRGRESGADALLVDDAHFLVRPVVDGLREFDRLIALARLASERTTWVFAFDHVIWQFFKRARETQPLFDEVVHLRPWSEDAIIRLVQSRCRAATVELDFSRLVPDLSRSGDSAARGQALEHARAGYHRILWDYSRGNPAVSLHFLRTSLGGDPSGKLMVRLARAPRAADLSELSDSTVFVLRAVVQLGEASPSTVAEATMLEPDQVADALRYAHGRGWLVAAGGRYSVPWEWYRAVTRLLERRHLLTRPRP